MTCVQGDLCYNKGEEIAPADIGFQYLMVNGTYIRGKTRTN